eukprot:CAMPEP_0171221160 /NCGR_PEP_ID=MMETSP0790-20130122/34614_1 /TAXON_ID=2925 /ORGANISM="Alexandrium catenella, Strain OF101" /LENGTH=73 /DNA_ID=CAMNT_0011687085 /DNA_START=86 /DNA_END=304 /DNA_ORIENTATION=+
MAVRRPLLALASAGAALVLLLQGSLSFVGPAGSRARGGRTAARVSAEYLERLGPKDADVPFTAAAGGAEHPVV